MERLDKIISNLGYGSRKEIKALVKKGLVKVDGEIVKDNGLLIDPFHNKKLKKKTPLGVLSSNNVITSIILLLSKVHLNNIS